MVRWRALLPHLTHRLASLAQEPRFGPPCRAGVPSMLRPRRACKGHDEPCPRPPDSMTQLEPFARPDRGQGAGHGMALGLRPLGLKARRIRPTNPCEAAG